MKKRIIGIMFGLVIIILSIFILRNYFWEKKVRDKAMGYCFDTGFDWKRSRLFVASGNVGMHVFEVSGGSLNFITTVYDEGYFRNLKVSGDRVYLADSERGLVIFDISKRVPVSTWVQGKSTGMGICVEDNFAYLAQGKAGLSIFDISTPDLPKLVGECETAGEAWDVWVNEKYAYVADVDKGVSVIDISSPSKPQKVTMVTWDEEEPMAEIIRGENESVYVAAGKHGLIVIDINNPLDPKVVEKYKPDPSAWGEGLCVKDSLVYLSTGHDDIEFNGLFIVDVHDPSSLQTRGKCTFPDWVEGVCIAGNIVFIANTYSGVRSIDVSIPDKPLIIDRFGPCYSLARDTLLFGKMTAKEASAIQEFRNIRQEIEKGKKYEDYSTPLRGFLTILSCLHFHDLEAFEKNQPFDFKKMGVELTNKVLDEWGKEFDQQDIFRAPPAPEHPASGEIWPIYVMKKNQPKLHDTQLCVFWNGKWMRLGNIGGPENWRDLAPKIRDILEKYGKK